MKIKDKIVTCKCNDEELYLAEKSGRKPNTVCLVDEYEYSQLIGTSLKKIIIIIQYGHEIFIRPLTDVRHVGTFLGKYLFVFSWQHTKSTAVEMSEEETGNEGFGEENKTRKTTKCSNCEGDILKARQGEFGKCVICGMIYRFDQDGGFYHD